MIYRIIFIATLLQLLATAAVIYLQEMEISATLQSTLESFLGLKSW